MKRWLPFLLIAFVAGSALAFGAFLYRSKTAAALQIFSNGDPGALPPQSHGPSAAAVTIEEFGDLQCPPCKTFFGVLQEVEEEYEGRLRVVFREFPLAMHQHAHVAATIAEAAGLQGKFWEMHDLLYRNQAAWSPVANPRQLFADYASQLGLDSERLQRDAEGAAVKARIAADQKRAESIGVNSTPTVFVNGKSIPPTSFTLPGLRTVIEAALNGKPFTTATPIATPTPTPALELK